MNISKFSRRRAHEVRIGEIKIGSEHPIAVQSMTNTDSHDFEATYRQMKELEEAGVKSLKIEGRMKSFYYAACTAKAYRKALDDLKAGKPFNPKLLEELKAVSHRDYTTGFFFGTPDENAQNPLDSGYRRTTDVVAVADEQEGWLIQKNKFSVGEPLWIFSPDQEPQKIIISSMEDEKGLSIESAPHAQMRVRVPFSLPPHSILRREHQ